MPQTADDIIRQLTALGDPVIAEHSQRFFKTGEGQYGAGDRFLGIRVPMIRKQVKANKALSLDVTLQLLQSPWHEVRLFSLIMLVSKFTKAKEAEQAEIVALYRENTRYVNNWDLVDSSAHYILGAWLAERNKQPLYDFAISDDLWERRIAIMSTFYYIKQHKYSDALAISKILLNDTEDLIHKAVGWMLREIGNRSYEIEVGFLDKHYHNMPRTMLRYAIEKLPEKQRQDYLKGTR